MIENGRGITSALPTYSPASCKLITHPRQQLAVVPDKKPPRPFVRYAPCFWVESAAPSAESTIR